MNKTERVNATYTYILLRLTNSSEVPLEAKKLYEHLVRITTRRNHISAFTLMDKSKERIADIESGLRVLEAVGYLVKIKKKDSKGRFYSAYRLKNN